MTDRKPNASENCRVTRNNPHLSREKREIQFFVAYLIGRFGLFTGKLFGLRKTKDILSGSALLATKKKTTALSK